MGECAERQIPHAFFMSDRGRESDTRERKTAEPYFKILLLLKKKKALKMKESTLKGISAGWSGCVAVCALWSFTWDDLWCQA